MRTAKSAATHLSRAPTRIRATRFLLPRNLLLRLEYVMVLLSQHVSASIKARFLYRLVTGCAFPAKRVVLSMGCNHAGSASECDRNLGPVGGETVPDEGSSEYQRQTRGHKPQDRTLLMFAIACS